MWGQFLFNLMLSEQQFWVPLETDWKICFSSRVTYFQIAFIFPVIKERELTVIVLDFLVLK